MTELILMGICWYDIKKRLIKNWSLLLLLLVVLLQGHYSYFFFFPLIFLITNRYVRGYAVGMGDIKLMMILSLYGWETSLGMVLLSVWSSLTYMANWDKSSVAMAPFISLSFLLVQLIL